LTSSPATTLTAKSFSYAKKHEHVLVTQERSAPNAKGNLIPDVLVGLGVDFTDTFKMLRETGARLDLRA